MPDGQNVYPLRTYNFSTDTLAPRPALSTESSYIHMAASELDERLNSPFNFDSLLSTEQTHGVDGTDGRLNNASTGESQEFRCPDGFAQDGYTQDGYMDRGYQSGEPSRDPGKGPLKPR